MIEVVKSDPVWIDQHQLEFDTMKTPVFPLVLGLLLFSGSLALADYDACVRPCEDEFNACSARSRTNINDIEVEDAITVCKNNFTNCRQACLDADVNSGTKPADRVPDPAAQPAPDPAAQPAPDPAAQPAPEQQ